MQRIVSFGDSFVFGSELANNERGNRAWPALAAESLGVAYTTCAEPGCGNETITRQILTYFSSNVHSETLAVINWTWGHRWDVYLNKTNESWATLGPMAPPHRYYTLLDRSESQRLVDFAKDYGCVSLLWNKWRSLQTMLVAQQFLEVNNIPNVQTYMDFDLFNDVTHAPTYIKELQKLVASKLSTWEGKNFLDWSRDNGYAVSDPGLHPLEDAHKAAADLWRGTYARYFT